MIQISKFNQALKEYEQKDNNIKGILDNFKNTNILNTILSKQNANSNYPFSHHFEETNNNIIKKWKRFEPTETIETIDLIKIGEFKNWLKKENQKGIKHSENVPVLLPIITQDKELKNQNRNIIFRNCKDVNIFMKNIITRIITSLPSKQIKLHLFDIKDKGDSFIDFSLLSPTILGEEGIYYKENQVSKKFQELHDKVIKLKQDISIKYNNIDEYNKNEDKEKEPYNFVFISNFPYGFNSQSLELLKDIMKYGNIVGFEVILDINYQYMIEENIDITEFLELGFLIDYYNRYKKDIYKFSINDDLSNYWFDVEQPLKQKLILEIIDKINKYIHNKEQKILTFYEITDTQAQSSINGINVPIGFIHEYNKKLYFDLTKDVYHCLIGGSTGSGKTVLLHTLINSLSYHYSPDEVELYLLDYKEGTEFKIYENLPHVSILSIASDIVFGLSILEKCLYEIENRGVLFKQYDVSNIKDYKEKTDNKLTRLIIIIDEFQVLFTGDSKTTAQAKQYIDDIVRRGRSFGIHLVLSTQTLQGVDLSNSTKSNTGLRIALKMNPEDASKILSDKNAEKPILLKKGEVIYNDTHGHIHSDKLFQVAYLNSDEIEKNILQIKEYYSSNKLPKVFDGNKLANIYENKAFVNKKIINNKIYIGEANFLVDEHKYFELEDEYSSNIIIIGSNQDDALRILLPILYSIKIQNIKTTMYNFNFLKKSNLNQQIFKELKFDNYGINDLEDIIKNIYQELQNRMKEINENNNRIILNLFNIANARQLYSEGVMGKEKNELLNYLFHLINEGAAYNIHIIIYSSMYSHLSNFNNKIKKEQFENKILVQGGDGIKLFSQTLSTVDIKNDTAIISEQLESFRLYDLYEIKEIINNG